MHEILKEFLLGTVTAIIPLLTAAIIRYVRISLGLLAEKQDNMLANRYLQLVEEAVVNAVSATNQTYVEAMKKAGEFTVEAQKTAAQMALSACYASLGSDVLDFLSVFYEDVDELLKTKIEAEIYHLKTVVID